MANGRDFRKGREPLGLYLDIKPDLLRCLQIAVGPSAEENFFRKVHQVISTYVAAQEEKLKQFDAYTLHTVLAKCPDLEHLPLINAGIYRKFQNPGRPDGDLEAFRYATERAFTQLNETFYRGDPMDKAILDGTMGESITSEVVESQASGSVLFGQSSGSRIGEVEEGANSKNSGASPNGRAQCYPESVNNILPSMENITAGVTSQVTAASKTLS